MEYSACVPCTEKLTIGSIRIDTNDIDKPVSYMCVETGVGSGSVYYESDLHLTEEEAFRFAQARAVEINEKAGFWVKTQYDESLRLSNYQLHACLEEIKVTDQRTFRYAVDDLLNEILDADDMTRVRELVVRFNA